MCLYETVWVGVGWAGVTAHAIGQRVQAAFGL